MQERVLSFSYFCSQSGEGLWSRGVDLTRNWIILELVRDQ